MFGYQHAGIVPDLVTMAKGLAGGLPLAAVVGTAAIMDAPGPAGVGGTYAGNALSCAAALAVLDIFASEDLVARAAALGETLRAGLERLAARDSHIGDVRGLGAMLAMELVTDRLSREPDPALAQQVVDQARERGLLLLKCGVHKNVVRLLPPLVTTTDEAAKALEVIEQAMEPRA